MTICKDVLFACLCLILFLSSIWNEYIAYFWVPQPKVASVEQITLMRENPSQNNLTEWVSYDNPAVLFEGEVVINKNNKVFIDANEKRAESHYELFPFLAEHTVWGNSYTQLAINSLGIANNLLNHYLQTKSEVHLQMAKEYILAYARWDQANALYDGTNNNDHALASRAFVVTKLWAYYRVLNTANVKDSQLIIQYASYLAAKLERDSFYTFHSNHGTMQNLALLLLANSFTALPDSNTWGKIAVNRFEQQVRYLLSKEGFFLEHSFGYHEFASNMLNVASTILKANKAIDSKDIRQAQSKAQNLLSGVRRRNGGLPIIGDTYYHKLIENQESAHLQADKPATSHLFYPVAGFSHFNKQMDPKLCASNESSITLFWSNFANHAHKTWNDATVDIFSCSTQWWRSVGYVPYWHYLRKNAASWWGSNAPHFQEETAPSPNSTNPIRQLVRDGFYFLETKRIASQGTKIYRNIYHFGPVYIINDRMSTTEEQSLESVWTMASDKRLVNKIDNNSFNFVSDANEVELYVNFLSNRNLKVNAFTASDHNILGWVQENNEILATTTVKVVAEPALQTSMSNISIVLPYTNGQCQPNVVVNHQKFKQDNYEVDVNGCGLNYKLTRTDEEIILHDDGLLFQYEIDMISSVHQNEIAKINHLTEAALNKYGKKFRPYYSYRVKATIAGCAIFVITLLFYLLISTFINKNNFFRSAVIVLWGAMPVWVHFFYFN